MKTHKVASKKVILLRCVFVKNKTKLNFSQAKKKSKKDIKKQ